MGAYFLFSAFADGSDFVVFLFCCHGLVLCGPCMQFMIHKKILCDHCRGTGAKSDGHIQTCPVCDGSGVQLTRQQMFPGMVVQTQST